MTFRLMPLEQTSLLPAVNVDQAIGDLPSLKMGEGGEIVAYDQIAQSEYARSMRAGGNVTFNHFAGVLAPQNVERMKHVKPGGKLA